MIVIFFAINTITYLVESFEFVTPISESSHSIDIEGIFSLTDGGDSFLQPGDVRLLIGFLTVVWDKEYLQYIKFWLPVNLNIYNK